MGFDVCAGYGNTATDIRSYKSLGLDAKWIFMLKNLCVNPDDTVALGSSFGTHYDYLDKLPDENSFIACPNKSFDW